MARVSAPTAIAAAQQATKTTEAPPAVQSAIDSAGGQATPQEAPKKRGRAGRAPKSPEPAPQAKEEAPATATSSRTAARPSDPPLLDGDPLAERITLPMWAELHRALALARIDDRVDTTVRIRAMIELWNHDPRLRARVDRLAKHRASTLHRGRPRKRAS